MFDIMDITMRPDSIEKYWYSIEWDVQNLWALNLSVTPMPIAELLWHLDIPLWPHANLNYQITPRQVLGSPQKYRKEFMRIQRADLSFPIEVIRRDDRWMILDGCHRLAKSIEQERISMNVRKIPATAVNWLDQCRTSRR